MMWIVCLVIALCIICAGVIFACFYRKSLFCKRHLSLTKILICTVFLSSSALFFPVYKSTVFGESQFSVVKSIVLSFHNAIRLFVVDGDFLFMGDVRDFLDSVMYSTYEFLFGLEFIIAPFLTFSFVLSFFKDLQANMKLFFNKEADTYVFSEINDRTILLAENIRAQKLEKNEKALIVFTDYFEQGDEESFELRERVNVIDALCFRKDITRLNLDKFGNSRELVFFIAASEKEEAIEHFITLNKKYADKKNCSIYFFSTDVDAQVINRKLEIDTGNTRKLKARLVSETTQVVFGFLDEHGHELFDIAKANNNHINVIINGLSEYGTMMFRSLVWFLIMHGYTYEIHCFDPDKDAENKLRLIMPEIFLCAEGKNPHDDSYKYNIKIHSGVNFDTIKYAEEIEGIEHPTFVFTSLDSDNKNIEVTSLSKRIIDRKNFNEGRKDAPCKYVTIIRNSIESIALGNVIGEDCTFLGDRKTVYSSDAVRLNKTERRGLERHLFYYGYAPEEISRIVDIYYSPIFDNSAIHDVAKTILTRLNNSVSEEAVNSKVQEIDHAISKFYGNEYNYKSSIASAIHINTRKKLKIAGADIPKDQRTAAQTDILCRTEHFRWSAYVRSDGFVYADGKSTDLKIHSDLIPYDELTDKAAKKDDV